MSLSQVQYSKSLQSQFSGVYLTDLTFLEDGNADKLEGDLINFVKRKKLALVIQEIQQYQQLPYHFDLSAECREYLNDMQWVDENELWNMSLLCEPRETASSESK